MFADELPLVEQAMADYENRIEKSPIVHPEIAGRGIEYAHGRAAFFYTSRFEPYVWRPCFLVCIIFFLLRCQGKLADMEKLCYLAYSKSNIPQELAAKFERRTNDYQRSYRMGVLSKDLEKMRREIKTHRNMMDFHHRFIKYVLAPCSFYFWFLLVAYSMAHNAYCPLCMRRSPDAGDATDEHILNQRSLSRILSMMLSNIFYCI